MPCGVHWRRKYPDALQSHTARLVIFFETNVVSCEKYSVYYESGHYAVCCLLQSETISRLFKFYTNGRQVLTFLSYFLLFAQLPWYCPRTSYWNDAFFQWVNAVSVNLLSSERWYLFSDMPAAAAAFSWCVFLKKSTKIWLFFHQGLEKWSTLRKTANISA